MSANTTADLESDLDIPPLREGDRLTADEFHRRYAAMPQIRHVNLVNGVVHMASPIRSAHHSGPQGIVMTWLGQYARRVPGVAVHGNGTLRVDGENEVEPDAMLVLLPEYGGRSWEDAQDYRRGAPELVVEIAASSGRLDAGEKRDLYERIGVSEYLLWRVEDDEIDWWALVDGAYEALPTDDAGLIRSRAYPGLWLDADAMVARDGDRLADVVDAGKASPEHQVFAARLA